MRWRNAFITTHSMTVSAMSSLPSEGVTPFPTPLCAQSWDPHIIWGCSSHCCPHVGSRVLAPLLLSLSSSRPIHHLQSSPFLISKIYVCPGLSRLTFSKSLDFPKLRATLLRRQLGKCFSLVDFVLVLKRELKDPEFFVLCYE